MAGLSSGQHLSVQVMGDSEEVDRTAGLQNTKAHHPVLLYSSNLTLFCLREYLFLSVSISRM